MAYADFQKSFVLSPIIFTYGIASNVDGGMLTISQVLHDDNIENPDDAFAQFQPLAGSNLIENVFGEYPFANQAVAANAVITQPLMISFLMICPVKLEDGYSDKLSRITSLKSSLDQHINSGGTFTLATPSYTYTNCLLISLKDVTGNDTKQSQSIWQWDFRKPLLTEEDADTAQNTMMNKISGGTPLIKNEDGEIEQSGDQLTTGQPPTLSNSTSAAGVSVAGAAPVGSVQ